MSEKKSHIIWKFLLITGFIVGLYIGSRIYSYYHTGADLMSIYQSGVEAHQHQLSGVTLHENKLSRLHPDVAYAITKTMSEAWYWLDQSYNNQSNILLANYFEEHLLTHIESLNRESIGVRSSVSHLLELKHVSLDKSIAVIRDHAAEIIYNYTIDEDADIPLRVDTTAYTAILVLVNGKWKIKNWISENVEKIPKPVGDPAVKASLFERVRHIKGINYYPAEYPWQLFWNNYDSLIIEADFKIISELGMNTVRIFLPFNDFDHKTNVEANLANLSKLLDTAEAYNLYVIPTLFDLPIGYEVQQYAKYHNQLKRILTSVSHKPALLSWNIKNEPDLDFQIHGSQETLHWLRYMINKAKIYDPIHPVTISWSTPEHLTLLSDELDYLSFHMYLSDDNWETQINNLTATLAKPIVLEEFGLSTRSGLKNLLGASEHEQANYLEECISKANDHQIPWMLWTLHDFKQIPDGVFGWKPWVKAKQKRFGIMRIDGTPKKIYPNIKLLAN